MYIRTQRALAVGVSESIKDKQHFGMKTTNRQKAIARDRNNKVNDYMNKAARKVIDYCVANDIGTLVVGYNETFQLIKQGFPFLNEL